MLEYFIFGINYRQTKTGTISWFDERRETILDENGTLCTSAAVAHTFVETQSNNHGDRISDLTEITIKVDTVTEK